MDGDSISTSRGVLKQVSESFTDHTRRISPGIPVVIAFQQAEVVRSGLLVAFESTRRSKYGWRDNWEVKRVHHRHGEGTAMELKQNVDLKMFGRKANARF
jgi:hypothetical protein